MSPSISRPATSSPQRSVAPGQYTQANFVAPASNNSVHNLASLSNDLGNMNMGNAVQGSWQQGGTDPYGRG